MPTKNLKYQISVTFEVDLEEGNVTLLGYDMPIANIETKGKSYKEVQQKVVGILHGIFDSFREHFSQNFK